jgi:APA family basic amino acid/polyamine antiporter
VGTVSTQMFFLIWAILGLVIYFLYGRRKSQLAPGNIARHDGGGLEETPLVHEGPEPGP